MPRSLRTRTKCELASAIAASSRKRAGACFADWGCAVAGKDHYLYSSASLVRRWVTLDPVHGRQLEAALASVHAVYLEQVRQGRRNGCWLLAPAPCREFAGEGSENSLMRRN
jgi:hypothetical protein